MPADPPLVASVTEAMNKLFEEGRLVGQSEAQQQFFGKAAAVLTATLFAAAMEQAASGIAPHDAEASAFFHEEALRLHAFVTPVRVLTHDPATGATGIVVTSPISVKFDGPIREETLTADTIFVGPASGGQHLSLQALDYDPDTHTVTLTPENDLSPGVEYRVTVGAVRAAGGLPLDPPCTFTFTTAA